MRIFLTAFLLLLAIKAFSQPSCEDFRKKEIDASDTATFRSFVHSLPSCGFDSIDIFILEPTLPIFISGLFGRVLISDRAQRDKHDGPTYGELVDSLEKLILSDEYQSVKKNLKPFLSLVRKKIILENWKEDSLVLLNSGVSSLDLDSIHQQILFMSSQMPELTYSEVMFAYAAKMKATEEEEKNKTRNKLQSYLCDTPKYASRFSSSNSLPLYYDYDQALTCAKKSNKLLLIDFNGWGCVNCKKMEKTVWQDSVVHDLMMHQFILVSLYVDDRTLLPEIEWYYSKALNKMIKTLGDKNFDLEFGRFNFSAQPNYVIVNTNGNQIGTSIGYCDKEKFKMFLLNALKEFQLQK